MAKLLSKVLDPVFWRLCMSSRRSLGQLLLLGSVIAGFHGFSETAHAQSAPSAVKGVPGISCYLPPLKLSDADIVSFLGRSSEDLSSFQGAGLPLSTRVRMLAASDVRTLAPILAHVRTLKGSAAPGAAVTAPTTGGAQPSAVTPPASSTTSPEAAGAAAPSQPAVAPPVAGQAATPAPPAYMTTLQVAAITEGLAAASVSCSRVGNELGTIIQEEVVKTGDEAFMQAFVKALETQNVQQLETAALGAAGAASASPAAAIGNDGQAGSNTGDFGDESVLTTSGEFSVSNGGARYFSTDGSGGSTDNQVSPTLP
ncbi:hypothetical protein [Rhizobium sp. CC-YZS058]|uniref:hypothetical protein n=1 Tax=Rhizobium sp. CC-YZS058 TaxID=3042153 RepID=UPI002B05543B|nr:hypothetical protein [Rhizobium sp. CC-YZS058]MEA3535463.1 hypothetical protein [Rhizobium sp. CC-YZS058]